MKGDYTNMSIDLDLNLQNLAGNLGLPTAPPGGGLPTGTARRLPHPDACRRADPAAAARRAGPAEPQRHVHRRQLCRPVIGCPLGAPARSSLGSSDDSWRSLYGGAA